MDPADPKAPRTELPDLFSDSGSSVTMQRNAQGNTLPSAQLPRGPSEHPAPTRRGHSADLLATNVEHRPASPAMNALAGEVLEWSPPRLVRVRYPAHDGWHNASGTLSSGFVVAMFEPVYEALAAAVAAPRHSAMVETSVRFFRAIRGGHVVVDGALLRAGRTTATVECMAWDSAGELCAKGSATLMLIG